MEEDPFAAFGDDSEQSDDDDNTASATTAATAETASHILAQTLKDQANAGSDDGGAASKQYLQIQDDAAGSIKADTPISSFRTMQLPWPEPLFLGPMQLVSLQEMGGGRGYVATRRLEPGTLVLKEEPLQTWPDEQLGNALSLVSVRHVLEHAAVLEEFHPTKRQVDDDADGDNDDEQIAMMMQRMRKECDPDQVAELVQHAQAQGITNKDGSAITDTDIHRLFLALRYNGLESGIYLHSAMLNHACFPNCAKLVPTTTTTYSEVRTTRYVAEGEPLTISYIPNVLCHASRRQHLWDQHRFDVGVEYLKGPHLKMELWQGSLPKSSLQAAEDTVTKQIESAIEDLEHLRTEYLQDIVQGTPSAELWEHVKAMEGSALEIGHQIASPQHILWIPCRTLHVETCQLLLLRNAQHMTTAVQLKLWSRCIDSACQLLALQRMHLGSHHFDVAKTLLDIANGVSELLSRSPQHLYDINARSFAEWKALEREYREEYKRIKALYE